MYFGNHKQRLNVDIIIIIKNNSNIKVGFYNLLIYAQLQYDRQNIQS